MKLWMMYHERDVDKNRWFIDTFIGKAIDAGIDAKLMTVEEFETENVGLPDIVVARMIRPDISDMLEKSGVRVCNDSHVSKLCNNKLWTIQAVHELGVDHIPTVGIKRQTRDIITCGLDNNPFSKEDITGILDRKPESNKLIDEIGSDYVIKSITGHGGTEVMTLSQYYEDESIILGTREPVATDYYKEDECIIQPLIASGKDLRVYVIGNEIIGAVLRRSEGDFRANYSLGGKVSVYKLSEPQKAIVRKILSLLSFDYIGIDFLLCGEDDHMIFNEIEDVVGAKMLSACTDVDYVNLYVNYILK